MSGFVSDALRVLRGASIVAQSQLSLLSDARGSLAQILVRTGGPYSSKEAGEEPENDYTQRRGHRAGEERRGPAREGGGGGVSVGIERQEEEMRRKLRGAVGGTPGPSMGGLGSRNTTLLEDAAAGGLQPSRDPVKGPQQEITIQSSSDVASAVNLGRQQACLKIETTHDRQVTAPADRHIGPAKNSPSKNPGDETAAIRKAQERKVPDTPFARLLGFGSLAAGLALGAASEGARRLLGSGGTSGGVQRTPPSSAFVTDANAERLANALSRMRGAALKLGQMLSMQDERLVPLPVIRALERVRQGADIMPQVQLEKVMANEFGTSDWTSSAHITHFNPTPIAAASIGQVHKATYHDPKTNSTMKVAMKVQYPGVGKSIGSDISNLKKLAKYTNLFPKSLYLDEALYAAQEELKRECDYLLEAENQTRFRSLMMQDEEMKKDFVVPEIIWPLTTRRILTSEFVRGIPIDRITSVDQRRRVANLLLKLTLKELFAFRFMQTDPNFSNFLYDDESDRIMLVDHGATREFKKTFVNNYLRLIQSCARKDREGVLHYSTELGFLTGEESKIMLDAHVAAAIAVGEPFQEQYLGGYSFKDSDIALRTARLGRTMLQERLCPPPKEAYSLHRRLSGAFLMCGRLGATVDVASMLEKTVEDFSFTDDSPAPISRVNACIS